MTEKELQKTIIDTAKLFRWKVHHTRPAMTGKGWRTPIQGHVGFPDIILCKPPRVLFVELKVGKNKPSQEQIEWLVDLEDCGVETYLWREQDIDEAIEILRGRSPEAPPASPRTRTTSRTPTTTPT